MTDIGALSWCASCDAYVLPPLLWNCADLQRRGKFPLESAGWAAVNASLTIFRGIEPPDNRMCCWCWRDLVKGLEQPHWEARAAAVEVTRARIAQNRAHRARGQT